MRNWQTACCVKCGKTAVMWTGHVLAGKKKHIAGWCSKKCLEGKGFYGHFKEWYG